VTSCPVCGLPGAPYDHLECYSRAPRLIFVVCADCGELLDVQETTILAHDWRIEVEPDVVPHLCR
jgi:hypothetical protein